MKAFRYQTVNVTVPNGSVAGTTTTGRVELDQSYARCTGFMLVKPAGTDRVEFGLRNDARQIVDYVLSDALEVNKAVPIADRFHPVEMQAVGRTIYVDFRPMVNAAMDNVFQVVLRLEDVVK